MNKFFAFAIMALVCASACAREIEDEMSQIALAPTESQEMAFVPEHLKTTFEDFCIKSRDWVLAQMQSSKNQMASNIFNIFFSSVEALGNDALEVQKIATEKLSAQLANPSASVERSAGQVNEIIADAQERIGSQTIPGAFFTAVKGVITATSSSVGTFFNQNLDAMKKKFTVKSIGEAMQEVCTRVKSSEQKLKDKLEEYKADLANPDEFAGVTLHEVGCATALRVTQIEGTCNFGRELVPAVQKIFGWG